MSAIISKIRKELRRNVDEQTRSSAQRYFKEKIKVYGAKTADVTKISKKYFEEIKNQNKADVFRACEELFSSGFMEDAFSSCNWSYFVRAQFEENDFLIFQRWIEKYVDNWATCDTLCNHTVGAFIEKYPSYVKELKKWAKSENRWMKRASAVTLIIPARHGKFLKDIFEIADILLLDNDDLVQKGYGWMLKAASQAHQKDVFDYVMKHKATMPRTALRYAIEKMPKELRKKAMDKENKVSNNNVLDKSFVEYIVEQIQNAGDISYKYMFGGCAIYRGSKVVALICDNQLYIRSTKNGKKFIKIVNEKPPYPGAKPHFVIEDNIDDKEWLCDLIRITAEELPQPKKRGDIHGV